RSTRRASTCRTCCPTRSSTGRSSIRRNRWWIGTSGISTTCEVQGRFAALLDHLDLHPHLDPATAICRQVLPEQHIPFPLAEGLQRGQRLAISTALAGMRVERGQDAAHAGLEQPKRHIADADALPAILGER